MNILKLFLICFFLSGLLPLRGEILKDARGVPVRYGGKFSNAPIRLPAMQHKSVQVRAVWCAVVNNLDFPRCATEAEFKKHFSEVLAQLRRHRCNVLIFQVRANGDAVYRSRYNPFSRWISGTEDAVPGHFDPLPYMVRECRRNGIEFHAWLNPYRITGSTPLSKGKYLKTLSPRHPARLFPDLVLASRTPQGTWALQYDPGRPEVINHILHTVLEIISKAPVDAIHFDDYFYPYTQLPAAADQATYRRYNTKQLSLADWRRSNVNALVSQVSRLCRSKGVRFGISPFGIWANAKDRKGGSLTAGMQSREANCADSLLWLQKGYLDYIIPQIYWPFAHQKAPYAAVTDWWVMAVRRYPGTALYIGHSLYNNSASELFNQLRYDSAHREIQGEALYSLRHLKNKKISQMLQHIWRVPVPAGSALYSREK